MHYERVFRYNILRAIRWSTTTVPKHFCTHKIKSLNIATCARRPLLSQKLCMWLCVVLFGVSVGSVVA
jgi:hypothetical protein